MPPPCARGPIGWASGSALPSRAAGSALSSWPGRAAGSTSSSWPGWAASSAPASFAASRAGALEASALHKKGWCWGQGYEPCQGQSYEHCQGVMPVWQHSQQQFEQQPRPPFQQPRPLFQQWQTGEQTATRHSSKYACSSRSRSRRHSHSHSPGRRGRSKYSSCSRSWSRGRRRGHHARKRRRGPQKQPRKKRHRNRSSSPAELVHQALCLCNGAGSSSSCGCCCRHSCSPPRHVLTDPGWTRGRSGKAKGKARWGKGQAEGHWGRSDRGKPGGEGTETASQDRKGGWKAGGRAPHGKGPGEGGRAPCPATGSDRPKKQLKAELPQGHRMLHMRWPGTLFATLPHSGPLSLGRLQQQARDLSCVFEIKSRATATRPDRSAGELYLWGPCENVPTLMQLLLQGLAAEMGEKVARATKGQRVAEHCALEDAMFSAARRSTRFAAHAERKAGGRAPRRKAKAEQALSLSEGLEGETGDLEEAEEEEKEEGAKVKASGAAKKAAQPPKHHAPAKAKTAQPFAQAAREAGVQVGVVAGPPALKPGAQVDATAALQPPNVVEREVEKETAGCPAPR